jgi:hypothetical protein
VPAQNQYYFGLRSFTRTLPFGKGPLAFGAQPTPIEGMVFPSIGTVVNFAIDWIVAFHRGKQKLSFD